MRKLLLGKKVILENINKEIISIHSIGNFPKIRELALEKKIPYIVHNKDDFFNDLNVNHQGIIGFLKNSEFQTGDFTKWYEKVMESKKKNKLVLLLDGIEDVGNFGAIIRTCDCFGVDGIVIRSSRQAPINETVVKNSMGAIYNSNILIVTNLSKIISELKKLNFWIVATDLNTDKNYSDLSYDFNCCLIIGNENKGISNNILNHADLKVKIPMQGLVDSLNVSVAAGVFLSFIKNKNKED